jgi:nicotinamide riboside kinase
MLRIGICGIPASGKTTLARALAARCSKLKEFQRIELVQEYAREYIKTYGNITSVLEQFLILEKQIEKEEVLCNNKLDILITDSPIFLGFLYSIELPKTNSKEIMFFNDIFRKMVELNYPTPRYDIIFHLCPIIKPVEDGIRPEMQFNKSWRERTDSMIRATMEIFRPARFYVLEQKSLTQRTNFCVNKIQGYMHEKTHL